MDENYSTSLEWRGAMEIGKRLSLLIPEGFHYELLDEEEGCKLSIEVQANSLEELREIVDDLLTLFSDNDQ